jgi:hypothetical protein
MTVIATRPAARFVVGRGGRVYIWLDPAGLVRVGTRPAPQVAFKLYDDESGFSLFQDERIPDPLVWKLTLRRLPRATLDAHWNARTPGGVTGSGLDFWRALFR